MQGNVALIKRVFDTKYGGPSAALSAWSERGYEEERIPVDPPSRNTLDRWRKGDLPGRLNDILRWSDLLDLDPFALVEISEVDAEFARFAATIATKYATENLDENNYLKYFGKLVQPNPNWPPNDMIWPVLAQNWYIADIKHDPRIRKNFMACLHLHTPGWDGVSPRTFHFAYRRAIPVPPFWTPYGTVVREENRARLYHTSGFMRIRQVTSLEETTRVGTEFGPGAAFFRIASLRPFFAVIGPDASESEIVHFGSPAD